MATIKKSLWLFALLFSLIALLGITLTLTPFREESFWGHEDLNFEGVRAIVLPHHLFVENFIETFYQKLAEKNDYDRIILISPNHFGYGYGRIQTAWEVEGIEVDRRLVEKISEDKAAFLEGERFGLEHGLYSHYRFLEQYFPKAKVLPIILKNEGKEGSLDKLVNALNEVDLDHTLVIASIDFSHGTPETVALKNDQRILEWLAKWSRNHQETVDFEEVKDLAQSFEAPEQTVAMDSPETFYVLIKLMEDQGAHDFHLWQRTSSNSLTGSSLEQQNVSHLFGVFKE